METNIPLHFSMFNSKVRLMNQTNGKVLTLSAQEARNLHADIFELLSQYSNSIKKTENVSATAVVDVNMDGGKF